MRMQYRPEVFDSVLTAVRALEEVYTKNVPQNIPEMVADNDLENVPEIAKNVPESSSILSSLTLVFQIQPEPVRNFMCMYIFCICVHKKLSS